MADVLVTAGATRNPLDAIRYLSAHASGRTGVHLAERLAGAHRVHLLGSAEACLRASPHLQTEEYTSTRDLMARMETWCRAHPQGRVVHSAAVGDYEAPPRPDKIPSGQASITFTLTPTPKIVDHIRTWSPDVFLVSFKAADPSVDLAGLGAIARAQLIRTGSDLVFANTLGRIDRDVLLVRRDATDHYPDRREAIDALLAHLDFAPRS